MALKRMFNPPQLVDDDYETWEREIRLWQCVTDLDVTKQGPAVYLTLQGQARQCCSDLTIDVLKGADGLDKLIDKLKLLYGKNEEQYLFNLYEEFETFKRPSTMSMVDYINEFERRYNKILGKKIALPDCVLAYRLLKSSNISLEKQTLVRATIPTLTLQDMKKQIRAIFEQSGMHGGSQKDDFPVKVEESFLGCIGSEEETLYNRQYYFPNQQHNIQTYGPYNNQQYSNRPGRYQRGFNIRGERSTGRGSFKPRYRNSDRGGKMHQKMCYVCKSILHFEKDCPHKKAEISLVAIGVDEHCLSLFTGETLNTAVLDSGCSKNVCGIMWLKCYLESLSQKEYGTVTEEHSDTKFKFGDGAVVTSIKKVTIPACIGSKQVTITTDVIEKDLPLLLSKDAMKKSETKIDFTHDKVTMLGEEIKLQFTSSGHYAVPIRSRDHDEVFISHLVSAEQKEITDKRKLAMKYHKQFAHASADKIIGLMKDAGVSDTDLFKAVRTIDEVCDTCKRYKQKKLRPAVGLSLAKEFNETVAMDLKTYKGILFLHIIDHATRFSAACIIKSKHKEEIIDKFFKHWIAIFGTPSQILSDNGGEFNNQLFRDMGELLNCTVMCTAAESPWQNGMTERHNAIISNMMDRIIEDTNTSMEVALAWSVSAKNTLKNVYGYSPNQLVFGRNPNFPTTESNLPPALEGITSSKLLADHLNAMHAARKAFIESEASEKLRRALAAKTRNATTLIFQTGDKVYYKRNDSNRWKGPGFVIGKDRNQVYVKHGGTFIRVNPIHLRLVTDSAVTEFNKSNQTNNIMDDDVDINEFDDVISYNRNSNSDNSIDLINTTDLNHDIQFDDDNVNGSTLSSPGTQLLQNSFNESTETVYDEDIDVGEDDASSFKQFPKKGSSIEYKMNGCEDKFNAKVIGRGGKVGGVNEWWANIQDLSDKTITSINLDDVSYWKYIEEDVLLSTSLPIDKNTDVLNAKLDELCKWKELNVYSEVNDEGQDRISTRWVLTQKSKDGYSTTKARLVARGFEDNEVHNIRKDSPTSGKESLRLLLVIASSSKWNIKTLDIKAAFLQGQDTERPIFLKPPKEAGTKCLWKLKKTVYGLADASREWYLRMKQELLKIGCNISKYDEALFFWKVDGELSGLISCHVDDFLYCGSNEFLEQIIKKIKNIFQISKEEEDTFKYLGLEIQQKSDHIVLHQSSYIMEINGLEVDNKRPKDDRLNDEEYKSFRSLVGQLAWASGQTRPDIAFETCQLSVSSKDPTVEDMKRAIKTLREVRTTDIKIRFPDVGDIRKSILVMYSDASFANLQGGGSQGGIIIFLLGENGNFVPICWSSKKVKRVVKSTIAAETLTLLEGAEYCILLTSVLSELFDTVLPIKCITDNKSLVDSAYSTKLLEDKRLRIDMVVIREMIRKEEISVLWTSSESQIANSLMKKGTSKILLIDALNGHVNLDV